jgi:hypothetical protein
LEPPNAADVRGGLDAVMRWTSAWSAIGADSGARVVRETRQMRDIGTQTMPVRVEFDSPRAVAAFCGEAAPWDRVVRRRGRLHQVWPKLAECAGVGRLYEWLEQSDDEGVERLIAVTAWFVDNPNSGLYLRQLPVTGVDTKWIEAGQRRAIGVLLGLVRGNEVSGSEAERDFLRACGLRAPASRVRVMVLDERLRSHVGGMRDIQGPVAELARLNWTPRSTLFIENLTSAHCLPDLDATVAVVSLGRAVSVAAELPWIHASSTLYWGDIDSDGLEILSLARGAFPGIRSVLMDRETLLRYRSRWVPEKEANPLANRSLLSPEERELYEALLANHWQGWKSSKGVRLEQERLDWIHVEEVLRLATASAPAKAPQIPQVRDGQGGGGT